MQLTDTLILPRAGRYARAKNASDILPTVYGDMSQTAVNGVWAGVLIDTSARVWCYAAHPVTAHNNVKGVHLKAFDDSGEISPDYYIVTYSGDYQQHGNIAYVTFQTEPKGTVRFQGKGKCDDSGALMENPIDILSDILNTANWSAIQQNTFAQTRAAAAASGYVAASVMQQDQPVTFWIGSLLGSFFGDWWINQAGELLVSLYAATAAFYPIAGYLREPYLQSSAFRSLDNICNQAAIYFAPNFTTTDRRTTSGASLGNYDGVDDGAAAADALSQARYGARRLSFDLAWVRSPVIAAALSAQLVARFSQPIWTLTCVELGLKNVACERGDFLVGGADFLRMQIGTPLINQFWRILEIEKDFFSETVSYVLQDTGHFLSNPPVSYNGAATVGAFDANARSRHRLI